jgi:hypothetical protein
LASSNVAEAFALAYPAKLDTLDAAALAAEVTDAAAPP